MPFLPFAVTLSVPLPQSVTFEPSLHLMTAFSAFSFSAWLPSLLSAVSERLFTVPSAAMTVTPEALLKQRGAVSLLESVSPSRTRYTPATCFLTVTLPSAQLPVRTYVPLCSILSTVSLME